MSFSMNKITLMGHVGHSPKINRGNTGKRTATFSMATSESWKSPDGERQEKTEWHNVFVLAEHAANFVANYVGKGDHVIVEGQVQTKEFTDREGNARKQTSVVVKNPTGAVGLLRANDRSSNDDDYQNLDDDDNGYDDLDSDVPF